jgi:hypothetical protein
MNRLILAFFAAINFAKVRILDERLKELHCFVGDSDKNQKGNQAATPHAIGPISNVNYGSYTPYSYTNPAPHGFTPEMLNMNQIGSESRSLAGGASYTEAELCREYFLSYSVFCAFMLTLFLTALLIVSEVYMRRLLGKVLEMEIDLEWQDVEEIEEESLILQDGDQLGKEKEKEKDILDITETIATTAPSLSLFHSVPSVDSAPPTYSLQLPVSLPSSPSRNPAPTFALIPAAIHPRSADYIPSPSLTSNTIKNTPVLPSSLQSHSRRARSVTSPEPYDERFSNFRSKIHAIGRAQSMNRGRSHTLNFGLPDGHMHREPVAPSPVTSDGSRKRSITLGLVGGNPPLGSEGSTPRLPPQCVILEHEHQMREMERSRGRSNTFIQYMSDSLPVTLLNSRYGTVQYGRSYVRITFSFPTCYLHRSTSFACSMAICSQAHASHN